jgi:hypothetical protein
MYLRSGACEEAFLIPLKYLYFAQRLCKVYIKMEEAVRNMSCNRTCMYLLLAFLMVAGNSELKIAEGVSYGQIQCTVSAFRIMGRGILDKIMVRKV